MKIILVEDVAGLGQSGDIVDVKPGYANNHLFRKGLALPSTPANMNEVKMRQKAAAAKAQQRLEEAQEQAKHLEGKSVVVKLKCGDAGRIYGSITSQDIADAIEAMGLQVDKRQIKVEDQVKSVGDYPAEVRLHPEVIVPFVLQVAALED